MKHTIKHITVEEMELILITDGILSPDEIDECLGEFLSGALRIGPTIYEPITKKENA